MPVENKEVREALVAAARGYLNVPFHHQGRSVAGTDCVGLLVLARAAMGWALVDRPVYNLYSSGTLMPEVLNECAVQITKEEATKGDLATFWRYKPGQEEHISILTRRWRMIHCVPGERRDGTRIGVVEIDIDQPWWDKNVGFWRFKELVA